ncbi:FecR domain-containing protein [uncultured Algoriphagus sp.]|uniref:FecR family protein n=1 Tax=uncultured Algoriphagus sp. TaxID=417365 RepID=UPI0030EF965F|tara:strand:+ start:24929 stop:25981 length:1053 start_codon:yes stop_codon:yes gene_type:complete
MNPELVKKFFDGKCSPEEVHQVLLWINSEEGENQLKEEFEKFDAEDLKSSINSKSILKGIHKRIASEKQELESPPIVNPRKPKQIDKPKSRLINRWKVGIAASFLLTIVASVFWLFTVRREENQPATGFQNQVEYLTKQTLAGEKLTLKLSDGSILQLNSNSSVRFPKTFDGKRREVYMMGQIFFDVNRDVERPFIVHSDNLITSVLGTSFVIEENSESKKSQVAVLTGKVKVTKAISDESGKADELFLEPMDAANFDGSQGLFEKTKVDYDQSFAWKDNVIVFRNASFGEVLKRLENWYGVKFQYQMNSKKDQDYTGKFEEQTLEEILIGLSFTYDFQYEINDSTIIIH